MAQHNLGMQMEHTNSFPMIIPILPPKSSTTLDDKKKDANPKGDADTDADTDEDTPKLPPPPPNVRNYK